MINKKRKRCVCTHLAPAVVALLDPVVAVALAIFIANSRAGVIVVILATDLHRVISDDVHRDVHGDLHKLLSLRLADDEGRPFRHSLMSSNLISKINKINL